ncbi:MAG: site-2 protease family protein [Candidatus Micrarchaeota archaeon]|nr:site-2 protease family protein [Candidatus Micrarchaeota archaeon]
MDNQSKLALAILSLLITSVFFFGIMDAALPAVVRFFLCVAALSAFGLSLMHLYKIEGWWGLLLLRSKHGLGTVESLSKKWPNFWQDFSDVGLVVGYGALAHFLMGKRKISFRKKLSIFAIGYFFLISLSMFIAPLASSALFSMISGGAEFATAGAKLSSEISAIEYMRYVFMAILLIGGLASMVTVNILIYGWSILWAIIELFIGTSSRIMTATPGGMPLIPGKNLPLLEGIAALAVVLAVHEALHGIIARIHKLPIKSAGLVFFGFLPFGAFVDIDEKKLFKAKKETQNSVFVAGTAANFATAIIFLALFLAFIFATESFRVSGVFVESGSLPQGARIISVNGTALSTFVNVSLLPNSTYTIATDRGDFERTTDKDGRIGIMYSVADSSGKSGVFRYANGFDWLRAIFVFLALTFALNFTIGVINLVPLPFFHRAGPHRIHSLHASLGAAVIAGNKRLRGKASRNAHCSIAPFLLPD